MQTKSLILSLAAGCLALVGLDASAAPRFVTPSPGSQVILHKMSNNAKWAISETGSQTEGSIAPSGGVLFNLETLEQYKISHTSGLSGVADVTDDGAIVVGECSQKPGFWSFDTKKWTMLPCPAGFDMGRLNAVTPDGKYAVGYVTKSSDIYKAWPVMYDLTTLQSVSLPNLPTLDMQNEDLNQNVFYDISPDGRYITGELSQSYLLPIGVTSYIYDRKDDTYKHIGFTPDYDAIPYPPDSPKYGDPCWTPDIQYTHFIDRPSMSPNGEWVTGFAYMVEPIAGSQFPNEGYYTYRYHIPTDKIEIFYSPDDSDIAGFQVLNDGTIIAASPAENPYAHTQIRCGKYFIPLSEVFSQVYDIDFKALTGFDNTGKALGVSNDGLTFIMLPTTTDSYIMKLDEPIIDAAKKVNLLGNYSVTPAYGSVMSSVKTFEVTFDRDVEIIGLPSQITLTSEDGQDSWSPLANGGIVADGKKVTITFRNRNLRKDQKYFLVIPTGMIQLKGDADVVANEITVEYTGRANEPVQIVDMYPAAESSVAHIDLTQNPFVATFDTQIQLVDGAKAYIYEVDTETGERVDGDTYATCNILANSNSILLYTVMQQHFNLNHDYMLVIPAGVVTDISGNGANEEYSYLYHGIYVPGINPNDGALFSSTADNFTGFMFYEGDYNEPGFIAEGWNFTADTTPWFIVYGNSKMDNPAFASHSMYADPGQSDDWMVTNQIYIPDGTAKLSFDAQSYLFGYDDVLNIYVYASEDGITQLSTAIVDKMAKEGDLIFSETLDPGKDEEELDGDWTHYELPLDKYAGKHIYIAFVNENDDQSAIFLDNIVVDYDIALNIVPTTSSRVVNQESIVVKGDVRVASDLHSFDNISITLEDAEGTSLGTVEGKNLNLNNGDSFPFEFEKPLPLQRGKINNYKLVVKADDEDFSYSGSVRNLTFEPYKRVVLEEYSGQDCTNCPLGILGIENLKKVYGDQILPISIRTYENDAFNSGLGAYSQFLGLDPMGAPSGILNRTYPCYPMSSIMPEGATTQSYIFSGAGQDDGTFLWFDAAQILLQETTDTEVGFSNKYDETTNGDIEMSVTVRNAIDADVAYNIFAVVIENGLTAPYQKNGYYGISDPNLGVWGMGGTNGRPVVFNVPTDDVARGTWGTTYNGTSGRIPSKLVADKSYTTEFTMAMPSTVEKPENTEIIVMVIDTTNGAVVNANIAKINSETSGVEGVVAETADLKVFATDGYLHVVGNGALKAQAYDMTGANVAYAEGYEHASIDLNGYQGVLIVKAVDAEGASVTAKVIVK